MRGINSNGKRLAPGYNERADTRRPQATSMQSRSNSMFVSDEEDVFGNHDDISSFLDVHTVQPIARYQPGQDNDQRIFRSGADTNATAPTPTTSMQETQSRPQVRPLSIPTVSLSNKFAAASSSPSGNTATTTTGVEIKEDPEVLTEPEWFSDVAEKDRVKIYVGQGNHIFHAKRQDLRKSPVLESYVVDDPSGGHCSFIMRPELVQQDPCVFESVVQFLHSGEYAPLLIEQEESNGNTIKYLDGLKTDAEHAKQLVKSGRLYRCARELEVEGMPDQIYRKITEIRTDRYTLESMIELVSTVFGDKQAKVSKRTTENVDATVKDKLEVWLISQIAGRFPQVMHSHQDRFWKAVKQTKKTMFFARLLEEVADRYRATGGTLAEPIVEVD